MATLTTAAATVLALALGDDDSPVTVLWPGIAPQADVERTFESFAALAQAATDSRIHGGIHYRFDHVAGQASGVKIATFVYEHFMRPRG
jgi:hypothetical protein